MERVFASGGAAAVVTATALLALYCAGRCAAARPLGPQEAVTSSEAATSALALPPAAGQRRAVASGYAYHDAGARAGKWLPFVGAGAGGIAYHHHVPAAFWAHKPVPRMGFGAGAHGGSGGFEGGGGEEEEHVLERERERSYDRGERDTTTRQEELAMWASLLNPKAGRRRGEANGWLPAPGLGEAVDEEPAKASDSAAEGAEVEDPVGVQVGQTKSGFYWGNNGN